MKRVLILGNGGSGKSTLGRRIAEVQGIPAVHLDRLFWRPGWKQPPDAEFRAVVEAAVAEPAWVMDGNYSRTFDLRLPAADTIIFLDLPRYICFARVIRRFLDNRGGTRPDMAPGCPEQIDLEFVKWIWGYPKRTRPVVLAAVEKYRETKRIVILKSPSQVRRFLASLEEQPRQC